MILALLIERVSWHIEHLGGDDVRIIWFDSIPMNFGRFLPQVFRKWQKKNVVKWLL
jgi:hypothetical protein